MTVGIVNMLTKGNVINIIISDRWEELLMSSYIEPWKNGRYLALDICKAFSQNFYILTDTDKKISLKFVLGGPTSITSSLVQIMAWRGSGNKPLIIWTNDDQWLTPTCVTSLNEFMVHARLNWTPQWHWVMVAVDAH